MSCIIKYNGREFSQEDFINFLKENGTTFLKEFVETVRESPKNRSSIISAVDKEVASLYSETATLFPGDVNSDPDNNPRFYNDLRDADKVIGFDSAIGKVDHKVFSRDPMQYLDLIHTSRSVENINNKFYKDLSFSPMSVAYQKSKVALGAAGKVGISAYSQDVVSHSLLSQNRILGGDPHMDFGFVDLKIGSSLSDGSLGLPMTLDGGRSIAEVLSERQNIATDNEKEQVMGRVNVNKYTLDFDKIMVLLGFDHDKTTNLNLSFLFLNQPIIKEYVKVVSESDSAANPYDGNAEINNIKATLDKFGYSADPNQIKKFDFSDYSHFTNSELSNLKKSLSDNGALSSKEQLKVLQLFLHFSQLGKQTRKFQKLLSYDSKGLGKSYFEYENALNSINEISDQEFPLKDVLPLLGEFSTGISKSDDNLEFVTTDAVTKILKPTTIQGHFLVNTLKSGQNLFGNLYKDLHSSEVRKMIDYIVANSVGDDASDFKKTETKMNVMKEFKKYIFSAKAVGGRSLNISQEERLRLMRDDGDKLSLGSYIKHLQNLRSNPAIDKYVIKNPLIASLKIETKDSGLVAIKHNNTAGSLFDESKKESALAALMKTPYTLPDNPSYNPSGLEVITTPFLTPSDISTLKVGPVVIPASRVEIGELSSTNPFGVATSNLDGRNQRFKVTRDYDDSGELVYRVEAMYNTRVLAQDLINYTFLQGGVMGANEFVKYVPIEYLEATGAAEYLRNLNLNSESIIGVFRSKIDSEGGYIDYSKSKFVVQYFQHNPTKAKNITSVKGIDSLPNGTLAYIKEKDKYGTLKFNDLFLYTKTSSGEHLFMREPGGTIFEEIDILKDSDISQYGVTNLTSQRSIAEKSGGFSVKKARDIEATLRNKKNTKLSDLGLGKNVYEIINKLSTLPNHYGKVLSELVPFMPKGLTVVMENAGAAMPKAAYQNKSKTIIINSAYVNTLEDLQLLIAKELIHAITMPDLSRFVGNKGELLLPIEDVPAYAQNISRAMLEGRNVYSKELEALNQAYSDGSVNITRLKGIMNNDPYFSKYSDINSVVRIGYALSNIHEFVESMLMEETVQQAMNEVQMPSGETMLQRFLKGLTQLFSNLAKHVKVGSNASTLATNAIATMLTSDYIMNNTVSKIDTNDIDDFATGTRERMYWEAATGDSVVLTPDQIIITGDKLYYINNFGERVLLNSGTVFEPSMITDSDAQAIFLMELDNKKLNRHC